ncbi:MAG: ribonuclease III, partial [Lachnospiraceae bacterium]|nr:ribonuclease III [Lachnospiraceae bacterium]
NPGELAPLILAHIGDAIYEVVIRTITLSKGNRPVEKVHKEAISYVNAKTQAEAADLLLPMLTEEEADIYRRGRNAKSNTKAKNASIGDYRKATGFEALMGYLYLKGETDRMLELIRASVLQEK